MQLRAYELLGNISFKENFEETLNYIKKEFIKEGKVFTRAQSMDENEPYPNMQMTCFDGSFKSPLSTYIGLMKRGATLLLDPDMLEQVAEIEEFLTHEVLKNPLSAGEGLRVLTYPKEAYRLIKVPKSWPEKSEFKHFISYFLPRFVLDYHNDETEEWQVCHLNACELKGVGLKDFIKTLSPQKPSNDSNESNQNNEDKKS